MGRLSGSDPQLDVSYHYDSNRLPGTSRVPRLRHHDHILTNQNPKVWITLQVVSILSNVPVFGEGTFNPSFLGDWLLEHCRLFSLDCYSCVSVILYFCAGASFPNLALIEPEVSSNAIWHRNKIVVAIAGGLWLSNVAASIEGKSLPLPTEH